MNNPEQIFRTETQELLIDLESALLDLENNPQDIEQVNRAFRAMHTIKGSGSMFGYNEMSRFTHHLEDLFDRMRRGEIAASKDIISIGLRAKDHIEYLLDSDKNNQDAQTDSLLSEVISLAGSNATTASSEPAAITTHPVNTPTTYHLQITPAPETFQNGTDPFTLLLELTELGECSIETDLGTLPESIEAFDPEKLYLKWSVTLNTEHPRSDIEDVFIFVIDEWLVDIQEVSTVPASEPTSRVVCPVKENPSNMNSKATDQANIIKIDAGKLDTLMDVVGELVIAQARLQQTSHTLVSDDLSSIAESFDRLITQLRDTALDIRMLPIGSSFAIFRRLVRDIASKLNKQVTLITSGEDTVLDKTLIDRLVDPLVHLLRNSLDHGIESPEQRIAKGKPEEGVLKISASHRDSNFIIEISDDGAGIDPEKLIKKAVERNIISDGDVLSSEEAIHLIFAPGFSTAEAISDISGRGVGMDAVKYGIESIGGRIKVHSDIDVGTRFTIELPLTLAIIEGLLVRISGEHYIIPLSAVEECVELTVSGSDSKITKLLEVRGELVPQIKLRIWFDIPGEPPAIQQAVISRQDNALIGVIVDEVIGEYQTVIKNLGPAFNSIQGISGATIMGTGGIALILDLSSLLDAIQQEPGARTLH